MEVLPTNGKITFHWFEAAKFFLLILTRFNTLNLVLVACDHPAQVRNYFQQLVWHDTKICENQLYFHKISNYYNKLIIAKKFPTFQYYDGH